eukprot:GHVS01090099.1.p1 GENE.GHVS01090099.1~~GHVS01090099.1.p1  ORF type:complete len:283 (-),score=43.66 GHVS01090099.1:117-965(-)
MRISDGPMRTRCGTEFPSVKTDQKDLASRRSSLYQEVPKGVLRGLSTNALSVDMLASNQSTASSGSERSPSRKSKTMKAAGGHKEGRGSVSFCRNASLFGTGCAIPGLKKGEDVGHGLYRQESRRRTLLLDEQELLEQIRKGEKRMAEYAELSKQLSQVYMECAEENDVTTAAEVAEAMERLEQLQKNVVDSLLEARYCLGRDDPKPRYRIEKPFNTSRSLLPSFLRHSSSPRSEGPRHRSVDTIREKAETTPVERRPTALFSNIRSWLPTLFGPKVTQQIR